MAVRWLAATRVYKYRHRVVVYTNYRKTGTKRRDTLHVRTTGDAKCTFHYLQILQLLAIA